MDGSLGGVNHRVTDMGLKGLKDSDKLRFKVKEENLEFRDAAWCSKNANKAKVSCKPTEYWKQLTPNDFLKVSCALNRFVSIVP